MCVHILSSGALCYPNILCNFVPIVIYGKSKPLLGLSIIQNTTPHNFTFLARKLNKQHSQSTSNVHGETECYFSTSINNGGFSECHIAPWAKLTSRHGPQHSAVGREVGKPKLRGNIALWINQPLEKWWIKTGQGETLYRAEEWWQAGWYKSGAKNKLGEFR